MAKVIDLQNVVVKRSNREILKAINLSLDASERWVILGPNGAGKTTLLRVPPVCVRLCCVSMHCTSAVVTHVTCVRLVPSVCPNVCCKVSLL